MSTKNNNACEDQQHNCSGALNDGNSPHTPPGRVLFHSDDEDAKDLRKDASRFLTAKYQKQQMGMIRKRIAIEDWMEEELSTTFNVDYDGGDCFDLDEILNIQGDKERTEYIKDKMCAMSQCSDSASMDAFIKKLVEKLQELK